MAGPCHRAGAGCLFALTTSVPSLLRGTASGGGEGAEAFAWWAASPSLPHKLVSIYSPAVATAARTSLPQAP